MKKIIIICSLLIIGIACNQKDDCQDAKLSVEHFDCDNVLSDIQVNLQNRFTIIRSREDYDAQVTGVCHPMVDFSRYDLIIGRQSTSNEIDTIIYDLRRKCPAMDLELTVDIVQSIAARPDNRVYHALIPKLGDEESILVKINIK